MIGDEASNCFGGNPGSWKILWVVRRLDLLFGKVGGSASIICFVFMSQFSFVLFDDIHEADLHGISIFFRFLLQNRTFFRFPPRQLNFDILFNSSTWNKRGWNTYGLLKFINLFIFYLKAFTLTHFILYLRHSRIFHISKFSIKDLGCLNGKWIFLWSSVCFFQTFLTGLKCRSHCLAYRRLRTSIVDVNRSFRCIIKKLIFLSQIHLLIDWLGFD